MSFLSREQVRFPIPKVFVLRSDSKAFYPFLLHLREVVLFYLVYPSIIDRSCRCRESGKRVKSTLSLITQSYDSTRMRPSSLL
jgi:hypothetical protein